MKLSDAMLSEIRAGSKDHREIADRFFSGSPVMAFNADPLSQINIFEAIKNYLGIPYSAIRVAGSARIGYSAHKKKEFCPGASDLDIAIVSHDLYSDLLSEVSRVSRGFQDLSGFAVRKGISDADVFKSYLTKGMIMTKYMPSCRRRSEIDSFFNRLQVQHSKLFREITMAVYLDDAFYIQKQKSFVRSLAEEGI